MNKNVFHGTGRTTRMLKAAIEAFRSGKTVEVLCLGKDLKNLTKLCEDMMNPSISRSSPACVRLWTDAADNCLVLFVDSNPPNFNWERMVRCASHRDNVTFVDHAVIEHRFHLMLEMLHQFDPACAVTFAASIPPQSIKDT